jgi:hypothetical protein
MTRSSNTCRGYVRTVMAQRKWETDQITGPEGLLHSVILIQDLEHLSKTNHQNPIKRAHIASVPKVFVIRAPLLSGKLEGPDISRVDVAILDTGMLRTPQCSDKRFYCTVVQYFGA